MGQSQLLEGIHCIFYLRLAVYTHFTKLTIWLGTTCVHVIFCIIWWLVNQNLTFFFSSLISFMLIIWIYAYTTDVYLYIVCRIEKGVCSFISIQANLWVYLLQCWNLHCLGNWRSCQMCSTYLQNENIDCCIKDKINGLASH